MFKNYLLADTGVDWLRLERVSSPKFAGAKIGDLVNASLPIIFSIAGIILLFFLLWSGIQYMTSAGDPKAIQTAKTNITYSIIGFLVIFTAYFVVNIMASILGLQPIKLIFQ